MNVGTLRVTTPDGQVRDYPIDAASAFIGRAEGNRVLIDHVSVSRRHARIFFEGDECRIEDLSSATGTFVGGERLTPGTPRTVRPGEALRFGDCHAQLSAASASPPNDDLRQASGIEQVTAVWLAGPTTPVNPGAAVSATVTVQNRGEVADTVSVSVQGIPQHWVRVTRDSLHLMPDVRDEVVVVIQPPRDYSAHAGDYEFAAAARSGQRNVEVRAVGRLTVLPFGAPALRAEPARSKGAFTLNIENNSNRTVTLDLHTEDQDGAVTASFVPPSVVVDPGSNTIVRVSASPARKRFFGGEERRPFSLVATGGGQPVAAAVELIERPPWLRVRWLVVAIVVLAAAAGAWFAYGAFLGDDDDSNQSGASTPTATATSAAAANTETPAIPTEETETPETPEPGDGTLQTGSTAVVVNSPEGSCLLVRRGPTRDESDPQSERIDRICDGSRVTILGPRQESEGFFWYPVRTASNVEGWAAEGAIAGGERYLEAAR